MGFRRVGVTSIGKGKNGHLNVKEQGSIGSEEAASVSAEAAKSMYMGGEGIRSHPFLHHPYRIAGFS